MWFPKLAAHKVYPGSFKTYIFQGPASLGYSDSIDMALDPVFHILMSPENSGSSSPTSDPQLRIISLTYLTVILAP